MNAEDVARYLREHPDFLNQHHELFSELTVPHPQHGGQAISLAERQLHALRDKIRALELKLAELIRFGEENDGIAEKVHRLGVSLMGAEDLQSVMCFLYAHLGGSFSVPHVAVRIWGVGTGEAAEFSPVTDTVKAFAGAIHQPYCGTAAGQEAVAWLGEFAGHVRSVAQIPLREGGSQGGACFGLLLLASEDPERFYPAMGTLYLERIGDMAAVALLRVVG